MNRTHRFMEIVVAGAGPAGIAAAVQARKCGREVLLVDDNPAAGGQIWRGGQHHSPGKQGSLWFRKLTASGAETMPGARIVDADAKLRCVTVETQENAFTIEYGKLIVATGARELFLPFSGWTIPNVMGVGGLQALVKSGLPVTGKRIVVAGTGPLLLAAAAYFRRHGAAVPVIAEQASRARLGVFILHLAKYPGRLFQAAALRSALLSSHYLPSCWVEAASGHAKLDSIRLRQGHQVWDERCDYLAIAYGFQPNIELPALLKCETRSSGVVVDEVQQSSQDNIYCAGECTGIGGVDLAVLEGEIAGYAAAAHPDLAGRLFRRRNKARRFAASLNRAFALRGELKDLPSNDTIVCRCEDVMWERVRAMRSWRSAKLHTRCGMGPCQGRVCGPILEFLLRLQPDSVRPPVFPARLETLAARKETEESASR